MISQHLARHVVTRQTDEGLIVELFDLPGAPLFPADSPEPAEILKEIVTELAGVFDLVRNDIAISGHLAARPVVVATNLSWELSTSRADATRRLMLSGEIEPSRIQRVTGHADRKPAVLDPMAARNNRAEVVLLRDAV